jgi:hypothetical protein
LLYRVLATLVWFLSSQSTFCGKVHEKTKPNPLQGKTKPTNIIHCAEQICPQFQLLGLATKINQTLHRRLKSKPRARQSRRYDEGMNQDREEQGARAKRRRLTRSSLMTWHWRSSSQPSWRPFSRTRSPMLTWRRPAASERREHVVVLPVPGVPVISTFGRARPEPPPPFCAAIAGAGFWARCRCGAVRTIYVSPPSRLGQ